MNQSTQLLSPLIRGPKCLSFYYYMYGGGIGNLDVFLWPREEQDSYLMWRVSGEQGDAWMKAGVDVGFTGESQVSREQNCKGYVKLFCVAGILISCLTDRKVTILKFLMSNDGYGLSLLNPKSLTAKQLSFHLKTNKAFVVVV